LFARYLDLLETDVTEQRAKSVGARYITRLKILLSRRLFDVLGNRGPDGFVIWTGLGLDVEPSPTARS